MLSLFNYLLLGTALISFVIAWQDFKERLVSLWALIIFLVFCIGSVIINRDWQTLLSNSISSICYFSFIWLGIKGYLYLKSKKNKNILNNYLGSADVIVILSIGITFNLIGCILFFCFAFIASLVLFLFSNNKTNESIPLAGFLVIFYIPIIFILLLKPIYNCIDCSFIN